MAKVTQRLANRRHARRDSSDGVKIPSHLPWLVWRLVVTHTATLYEVMTFYDLVDVLNAHESLDLLDEAELKSRKKTR